MREDEVSLGEVVRTGFPKSEEGIRVELADARKKEFSRFIRDKIKNAKSFKELNKLPCERCFNQFFKADLCELNEPMENFCYLNYKGVYPVRETTLLGAKTGIKETVVRILQFEFICEATNGLHKSCFSMNVNLLTNEMKQLLAESISETED